MSRSYRKHFVFAEEGDRRNKKWFNRRLRHQHIISGGYYKKLHNSREIKNFEFQFRDEDDFVRQNLPYLNEDETEKDLRKIWRKYFLSK